MQRLGLLQGWLDVGAMVIYWASVPGRTNNNALPAQSPAVVRHAIEHLNNIINQN